MRPTSRAATGSRFLCPIWSCSGWGLHERYVTISPCELLPHNFNLTTALSVSAVCFCCTFPIVTYAGRYPASCPAEPGLSSSPRPSMRRSGCRNRPARFCALDYSERRVTKREISRLAQNQAKTQSIYTCVRGQAPDTCLKRRD